jgi:hypothetical protein
MRQCQFNFMENKFLSLTNCIMNIHLQTFIQYHFAKCIVGHINVTQKVSKTFPEFSTHGKQQFPYIIKKFPKSRACIIIYTLLYCDCDDICRIRDDIEAKMSPYCKKNWTKKCTHRKCNSNY